MSLILRIALSLAAASAPAAMAVAADYDPPMYVEDTFEVPVEIGSGWYLRGDVTYSASIDFEDKLLAVTEPYGDFLIFSPLTLTTLSENRNTIAGSVGFGYQFNQFLRADLNLGFLPSEKSSVSAYIPADYLPGACGGTETVRTTYYDDEGDPIAPPEVFEQWSSRGCGASLSASNTTWTAMANGYIDLGTYVGITPYVGAGIGVLYTKNRLKGRAVCSSDSSTTSVPGEWESTTTFLCDGQDDLSDPDVTYVAAEYKANEYNLMYSLNAGVAYQVSRNTSIDLGYQFLSAPDAQFVHAGLNGPEVRRGLDYHQVKLGLRYQIW